VIEIHSPGDETYEKFPFFAKLGVREVVVIDRDTKVPEVHRLEQVRYSLRSPGADGWILCMPMQVELRVASEAPAVLEVRDAEDLSHGTRI
jgi:Uma2 family endonuclease